MSQRRLAIIIPVCVIALIIIGGGWFIVSQKNASSTIETEATNINTNNADNNINNDTSHLDATNIADGIHLLTEQQIAQRIPNLDKFPQNPQRIVVMEFSFLGDILAVGLQPIGVADDNKPDSIIPEFRDKVSDYTSIGSRYQPSLETIADLKPDLIIADEERHTIIADELNHIAPAVVFKSRGESYEENLQTAQLVGHVVHQDKKMAQAINQHLQTMHGYKAQLADSKLANQTIQFAIISDKGMWFHGPRSYAGSVLEYLNINSPIPEQTQEAYIPTSLEQLVSADPDWLLIGRYNDHTVYDEWQSSPLFQQLKAVKNNHVIEVDPNYWALNRSMQSAEHMAQDVINISQ